MRISDWSSDVCSSDLMQERLCVHLQCSYRWASFDNEECGMSGMQHDQRERPGDGAWRKSTYSNPSGNCVEVAEAADGSVAVRNSRYPPGSVILYTRPANSPFIHGAKDGASEHLHGETVRSGE